MIRMLRAALTAAHCRSAGAMPFVSDEKIVPHTLELITAQTVTMVCTAL